MKQRTIFDDQYIIITGAAGFIGSGVVRYLNDQGRTNLILVDNLDSSNKWKNLVGKQFFDFLKVDELFPWLEDKASEIEAFIHLGACSDTLEKDADFLLENNFRYTQRLAEYALLHDHRFIYASSAATYGNGAQGFSDDHDLLETLKPINMYAYSKHLFDLWVKKENVLDKVVGLKYFNVFGPNENHKGHMSSMIYKMTNKVLEEGKISLFKSTSPDFKDGDQARDFIYIKDAVRMTCNLLEDAFKDVCGIFNIGRGEAVTWNCLANALFDALGKKPNIEYIDMPKELIKQYQNYTLADMTKYYNLHKLTPKPMSIEASVKEYVQQYLLEDERW